MQTENAQKQFFGRTFRKLRSHILVEGVQILAKARGMLGLLAHICALVSAFLSCAARLFRGAFAARSNGDMQSCNPPHKLLQLYDMEGCPFCRKVREVLSMLELDYEVYPCPKESVTLKGDPANTAGFEQQQHPD